MKPRILISAHLYGPAGIETHLLNLCRLLIEHGADVTLATRIARPLTPLVKDHKKIGVRLISTPFAANSRLLRCSTAWALTRWPGTLRREKFDVLYSLGITRFLRFLAGFVKPEGHILWNRVGDLACASEEIDPSLLKLLSGVLVETDLQAQAIRDAYGISAPVAAIPLMANCSLLAPRKENRNGTLRVAYLGRYDRNKGVYRLLDVWRRLNLKSAKLDFYGFGAEDKRLRARVAETFFDGSVQVNPAFFGKDLGEVFANADLLVLPSISEGLPLVLLEAMAHGVPFVATDVGAVRTLANDNPDVMVVPNEEEGIMQGIEAMAHKIRSGEVSGARLQSYHRDRYNYDQVEAVWLKAFLKPETFWHRNGAT